MERRQHEVPCADVVRPAVVEDHGKTIHRAGDLIGNAK
jgi:hypothetical protein